MKKNLIITAALILLACVSFAQNSNLIFFTEQGEQFFVVLNGVKQNNDPRTNVKVTNLSAPTYKCKIMFSDPALGQIDKTIYVKPGVEATYTIKKNNKNEWVIRWMNEAEITASSIQNQTYDNNAYVEPNQNNQQVINTTTTTVQPQNNDNIGVNIVDPVSGTSVKMNINAGNMNGNIQTPGGVQTTTTTTTTYSTTTTSGDDTYSNQNNNFNDNGYNNNNFNKHKEHKEHHNDRNNQNVQAVEYVPGYTGAIGCPNPMGTPNFQNVKQTISSKTFEDSKLTIAKQVLNNNCLLTSQVKEILLLFTYESTKLDFAKYAYGYTYDIGNYYMLNDAFQFESSIDELNSYITKKK